MSPSFTFAFFRVKNVNEFAILKVITLNRAYSINSKQTNKFDFSMQTNSDSAL